MLLNELVSEPLALNVTRGMLYEEGEFGLDRGICGDFFQESDSERVEQSKVVKYRPLRREGK